MRGVLSHVDLENCRSIRCAHTARIDAGVATSLPLPGIPHSHPHLALKQYQFQDDLSSSHSLRSIGPDSVYTYWNRDKAAGFIRRPAITLKKKASMPRHA
jgi:hypothetical protein